VERHTASGDLSPETDAALLSKPAVDAFERHILVKRNIADVLTRTLEPARVGDAAIVIGTATDPYQPAERRFGITRSVLEALLKFNRLHLGIITKSPLIVRDIPLLRAITARHRLKIHVSLATCDGSLLRRLEPRTPMPHARIRALAQLTAAGLDAGVLVAPIVPLLTDSRERLAALFRAARDAGATRVNGGVLRLGPTARKRFFAQIATEFPELLAVMNGTLHVPATPSLPIARHSRGGSRNCNWNSGFHRWEDPRHRTDVCYGKPTSRRTNRWPSSSADLLDHVQVRITFPKVSFFSINSCARTSSVIDSTASTTG
jgi:hypothetical protein